MKLMSIAGARPNFMKLAAIARAVERFNEEETARSQIKTSRIEHIIVHTGQHYDQKMSGGFFTDLGIPEPQVNLGVGSASHAVQTAEIMKRFEPVLMRELPDVLLVVGDVNSTVACALVAAKAEYPTGYGIRRPLIAHVEAGLRSFDRNMPEEINRILTDALSDLLFVTEESGIENLMNEGAAEEKIHFVGNVMIDTLEQHLDEASQSLIKEQLGIKGKYCLVTLHRPSNVDRYGGLKPLVDCLMKISERIEMVFPVHPRTNQRLREFNLLKCMEKNARIVLADPLSYLDFLHLTNDASIVVTDSGGIQEETTYLQVPCITLRDNTERPVTVSSGSNYLVGTNPENIIATVIRVLNGHGKEARIPERWDGKAGQRIIDIIANRTGSYPRRARV